MPTVKELMEILKQFPEEAQVLEMSENGYAYPFTFGMAKYYPPEIYPDTHRLETLCVSDEHGILEV